MSKSELIQKGNDVEVPETAVRRARPLVDIFEGDNGFRLMFDLPGVVQDDLELRIEDDELTISAPRKLSFNGTIYQHELAELLYERKFQLPAGIDNEAISANFKNGVLDVLLPKSEAARPRRIEVKTA